jgi:hypothetical protein
MRLPTEDPYERALLTAACATGEEAVTAWNRLAYQQPPADWPEPWRRLLPAIWLNLKDRPKDTPVYRDRLARYYRDTWGGNMRLRDEVCELVRFLGESGVEPLLLKGLWVVFSTQQDVGARPCGDIDLLVRFEQADQALTLLLDHGWEFSHQKDVKPRERLVHATELYKNGVSLDLHWFLLPEARLPGCDAVFWNRSQCIEVGETTIRGLAPNDQIFHLLVLAEREPHQRVRYFFDLLQVWSRYGNEISCEHIIALLRERRLLSRGLPILEALSGQCYLSGANWLDRVWSKSTQAVHDGSHEFYYAIYPLLDYYLHYNFSEPKWSLAHYLRRRLEIDGLRDLVRRSLSKATRTVFGSFR